MHHLRSFVLRRLFVCPFLLLACASVTRGFNISVSRVGASTLTLNVEASDTIDAVRALIQTQTAIAPARQTLKFGTTTLVDGQTLSNYAIAAGSTIALTAPVYTTLSGAINASSPTFVRPTGGTTDANNVLSPPFTAGTTSYKYFTQTITPTVTGAHDFTVTGTTGDTDPYLFVYSPSFDPASPLANALVANDDQPGSVRFAKIPAFNLTAGTTYVIVATFFNATATGTITLDLVGPGAVTISGGPTISGVTSSTADATYAGGSSVSIQVSFNAAVTVTGTPALALNTSPARNATYTSGSGTTSLTFTYLVQPGDASADLDYAGTSALTATGGATITNTTGTSATLMLATPGASGSLGNAKAIVIASTTDGAKALYGWGWNVYGQLGDGTNNNATRPVAVTATGALSGKTVTAVANAEFFTLALTSEGRVYTWGANSDGQLGNNSTTGSKVPVAVDTSGVLSGKTVTAIAAGRRVGLVLTSEGRVYSWGTNYYGALGNDSAIDSKVPVAVSTSGALAGKTVTAIAAGDEFSAALTSDGRVYIWGQNSQGGFGDSLVTSSSKVPKIVPNTGALAGKTITAIAAATNKVIALAADGTLFQWGYPFPVVTNTGDVTFSILSTPQAVVMNGALAGKTVTRIAAGRLHNLALTSDGTVYTWGRGNGVGAPTVNLGRGSTDPVAVDATGVLAGKTVTAIAGGSDLSVALTSEGKVVAWGENGGGGIGADTGTEPDPYASSGGGAGPGGRSPGGMFDPFDMPRPPQPKPAKSPVAVDTSGVLNGTVATTLGSLSSGSTVFVVAGSAAAPVVASLAVPTDGSKGTGASLNFTVTFSSAVTVTGTPSLSLTIGSTARAANYVSGSGTTALLFRYTVQAGESDTDGIALAPTLALNGGTISGAGGTAALALAPPNLTFVTVDTAAPAPTASLRKSPLADSVTATSVAFRVVFDKVVAGVTTGSFALTTTGTASGVISKVANAGFVFGLPKSFDVTVSSLAGAGTLRLDVKSSGSGITDSASNAITSGFTTGETYTLVPAVAQPVISSATTASGTYGSALATYTIAASNTPASFTATGLPTGLTLDATTGAITGTPTQAGSFTVTLGAINAGGTGTATLSLAIAKAALTVTANNATRSVGTANPVFTVSYTGFVNGDTAAALTAAPIATCRADVLSAPGTYSITPYGGISDNYAFTPANGTLTVGTVPATLTLSALSQTYTGASLSPTVTSSPANVPVGFTFDGSATTPANAGTYAVVATSISTANPGTTNGTFTIAKASQTITLGALPTTLPLKDFVGALQLTATSTSGLTVALTLDAGSAATLNASNQLVSIGTTGTVTIRANQAGNGNYNAGTEVVASFNVVKSNQSIAFTQPANVDFGTTPAALVATATSTLAPTFTIVSGPATVAGSTLTLTGAGTVIVRASQAGDGTFNAAPDVTRSFTVFQTPQAITFADFTNATYGDAALTLGATSDAGLAVTYAVTRGPATIAGNTLTVTGAGTIEVTASQAGNANVAAAPDFTKNLVVAPKALTATAQNATRVFGAANPALTVAYTGFVGTDTAATSLLTPVVPSTTANLLSVAGAYPINLNGGSSTNYTATLNAGTLTVTKASQTIAFSAPPAQVYGNTPFTLGAAASSGLTPTYTINSGPATVTGNTVTLTGTGTVSVTAAQAGDAAYDAAPGVTQTFAVTAKPLTVAGVTASNKVYDGALTATPVTTAATLVGVQAGDTVTLVTAGATGTFATKTVATGKAVTVAGLTLAGASAANYSLTQPTTAANITAKALNVSGTLATSRVYDATTAAALTTTASALVGVVGADVVTLVKTAATGTFAGKTIGTAKPVTIAGFTLSGADAANYSLTQPAATADITAKNLTVSGLKAFNKFYNGSDAASLNTSSVVLIGVVGSDAVTLTIAGAIGKFDSSIAGASKPVSVTGLLLAGADAGNYTLTQPTTSANIDRAPGVIALGSLTQVYNGAPRSVSATTTPAGLGVTITYGGSTVAPTNAGSHAVSASISDANHSGTTSGTLTIVKATQTVTVNAPSSATLGTAIGISASASSGFPVTLTASGPATLAGNSLTFSAPGTATITATQAGDANHEPASATATITAAGKLAQTIAFGSLGDRLSNSGSFTLNATASSGLLVSFSVGGPALLSGNTVTLTGAPGLVTVRASQSGNAIYEAAADVTATFNVSAATVSVFFGSVTTAGSTTKSGDVAATLPPNSNQGSLLIVAPNVGINTVLDFTLNPDGTFTQTVVVDVPPPSDSASGEPARAAAPVTLTLRGTLVGGRLAGTIEPLGLAFSTTILPVSGPSANAAGLYRSSTLAGTAGSTFSIVGTNNEVLVLAQTGTLTAGALTTLNADGTFAATTGNATIRGSVDAPSTTVSGTIIVPGRPDTNFAGLVTTTARTDRLVNLSSRVRIGTGASVLITGFVIGGSESKAILVRGVGPSLTGFGIQGALANPRLRLYRGAEIIAENDDWSTGADSAALAGAFARVGAFGLAPASRDAALLITLAPGAYTAQVFDSGTTGVALAEIYDAGANPNSEYQRLVNISTRGEVTAGEGVLIGGFVVTGNSPKRLLVRGVGPGLAAFAVAGPLADPRLRIFRGSDVLAENDNWSAIATDASTLAESARGTGAFALATGSRDAALVVTLAPGAYTAQVSAADNTATGIALVEIYELP